MCTKKLCSNFVAGQIWPCLGSIVIRPLFLWPIDGHWSSGPFVLSLFWVCEKKLPDHIYMLWEIILSDTKSCLLEKSVYQIGSSAKIFPLWTTTRLAFEHVRPVIKDKSRWAFLNDSQREVHWQRLSRNHLDTFNSELLIWSAIWFSVFENFRSASKQWVTTLQSKVPLSQLSWPSSSNVWALLFRMLRCRLERFRNTL